MGTPVAKRVLSDAAVMGYASYVAPPVEVRVSGSPRIGAAWVSAPFPRRECPLNRILSLIPGDFHDSALRPLSVGGSCRAGVCTRLHEYAAGRSRHIGTVHRQLVGKRRWN